MAEQVSEGQTESQLNILKGISAIFCSLEHEFWIRGGWAIDFLLGKVTRLHDDIDLITWIHHREQLELAMMEYGFERIPVREQFRERQSDFRKDNVEVTLGYITRTNQGNLIMNGLQEWEWNADSLMAQCFILHGISARVLSPRQLLDEKVVYAQIGRTARLKDVESKKILQRIISNEHSF